MDNGIWMIFGPDDKPAGRETYDSAEEALDVIKVHEDYLGGLLINPFIDHKGSRHMPTSRNTARVINY